MTEKYRQRTLDRILRILMTIDLVFYLALFAILRIQNFSDFRLLFLYPAFGYPLSLILWVLWIWSLWGLYFRRPVEGRELFFGFLGLAFALSLTPAVFSCWRTLAEDPGLIFEFLMQKELMATMILARWLEVAYLLLDSFLGKRPKAKDSEAGPGKAGQRKSDQTSPRDEEGRDQAWQEGPHE